MKGDAARSGLTAWLGCSLGELGQSVASGPSQVDRARGWPGVEQREGSSIHRSVANTWPPVMPVEPHPRSVGRTDVEQFSRSEERRVNPAFVE